MDQYLYSAGLGSRPNSETWHLRISGNKISVSVPFSTRGAGESGGAPQISKLAILSSGCLDTNCDWT